MKQFLSSRIAAAALTVIAATLAVLYAFGAHNADLMASWIAGQYLHAGLADHVYPGYTEAFTLHPHPAWPGLLAETAYRGPVFPFIYPPGWAWAMGHLPDIEAFWVFAFAALLVNTALLAGTIWLAMRIMGAGMPPVLFVLLAVLLLGGTDVGMVALYQGQPQILVSFLMVLAIERSRSGDQVSAGAALALAAALKLYPAVFALIFLVSGERRALASFALVGASLAGLSIVLTGWDLHRAFLHEVSIISDTVLVTGMSSNIQSVVAQIFFADDLVKMLPIEVNRTPDPDADWHYLVAGFQFGLVFKALFAAILVGVLGAAHRAGPETRATIVWPLALTATALLLPLSWSYYFIPGLVFLPGVVWRLGGSLGTLSFAAVFVPLAAPIDDYWPVLESLAVTVPFLVLFVAILASGKRPSDAHIFHDTAHRDPVLAPARALKSELI